MTCREIRSTFPSEGDWWKLRRVCKSTLTSWTRHRGGAGPPPGVTGQGPDFIRDSEVRWKMCQDVSTASQLVLGGKCSRSPVEPCSLAKPPCSPRPQSAVQSQAQVLSLYISRAFNRVKILLDVFGKLCRTWLILDFPKFILSVRPLSDFYPWSQGSFYFICSSP